MEKEAKKIELEKILQDIYSNDKTKSHYGLTISQRNDIKNLVTRLEKERDELKDDCGEMAMTISNLDGLQETYLEDLQVLKDSIEKVCKGNVAIGVDILLNLIK